MAITPLWKGLGKKLDLFWKNQEILYLIDTKNVQFDLSEAEKIMQILGHPLYNQ